jgi:hypothetical protein
MRVEFENYIKARPTGPLGFLINELEYASGPHSIGEKVYIIDTVTFGTIIMGAYEGFLRIYWEDGIISADFNSEATLYHIIKVLDDSPQERLKLILKYGS